MASTQKDADGKPVRTDTPAFGCFEGTHPEKPATKTKPVPAPAKAPAPDPEGDN